jgi:hypothetical protein
LPGKALLLEPGSVPTLSDCERRGKVLELPEHRQSIDFVDNVWLHRIELLPSTSTGEEEYARARAIAAEIDRISKFCPIEQIVDRSGLGLAAYLEKERILV